MGRGHTSVQYPRDGGGGLEVSCDSGEDGR